MREPLKDKNRLEHILDAIEIICQRTSGMSFDDFTADKVVYGGIVYYTMIIGEAAYKLSREFIEAHSMCHGRILLTCAIIWYTAIIRLIVVLYGM